MHQRVLRDGEEQIQKNTNKKNVHHCPHENSEGCFAISVESSEKTYVSKNICVLHASWMLKITIKEMVNYERSNSQPYLSIHLQT